MDKCNLHTILRLPPGIFYAQGVKTNVMFFSRGEEDKDNTQEVWVYDLRANVPTFGQRTQLERSHFADFEAAFGDDPLGQPDSLARRHDSGELGKFRRFTRAWIRNRDNNLDIAWLKEQSRIYRPDLPEPTVLAEEAIDELETALEALRGILAELGEDAEK